MAARNSLVQALKGLRGNQRACVLTEPLWGLSMNLCLPYASVYMLALGLHDMQIGLLASIGMVSQTVWGLLSGIITDKLGRRLTLAVFDAAAWSVPCLIWASASLVAPEWAFWAFAGASLVNGTWQVSQNAWDCLLVEGVSPKRIPAMYSLVMVAGNLSALAAPVAAVMVAQFSLVPAVRILYLNAFVVMTAKAVLLYAITRETEMGLLHRTQTRGRPWRGELAGYREVLALMRRSRGTKFAVLVTFLVGAVGTVAGTFWQVIVSQKLLVPDPWLPLFPMVRSLLAIAFYFTVIPRLTKAASFKTPLLAGFAVYAAGQLLVAVIPAGVVAGAGAGAGAVAGAGGGPSGFTLGALAVCLICDGFGLAILAMLAESLVAIHADNRERSRVMAVQRTVVMLATAPFGWIGGVLSSIDRSWPFFFTAALLILGLFATLAYHRSQEPARP
ncbi:MAG: MFS transporter [Bifidobacteriaceae bacterium]|jgi:MFS family permease|nr:MFS transporter [Bifidobacteriaceae bacterium]